MKTTTPPTNKETTITDCKELLDVKLKVFHSQMNPHFIFNALNAIQYFITSNQKELALKYLSVFSKLMRFNLKQLEKESVALNDEVAMLHRYLKLQKLRYAESFEYEVTIDKYPENLEAKIPSSVIQTMVENIIEHAIYNQHKNHTIKVHFISRHNLVTVNVIYEYEPKIDSKHDYTPAYRKQIIKWQDQIRFLNKTKKYTIDKNITFQKNGIFQGGKIILKLPNLS